MEGFSIDGTDDNVDYGKVLVFIQENRLHQVGATANVARKKLEAEGKLKDLNGPEEKNKNTETDKDKNEDNAKNEKVEKKPNRMANLLKLYSRTIQLTKRKNDPKKEDPETKPEEKEAAKESSEVSQDDKEKHAGKDIDTETNTSTEKTETKDDLPDKDKPSSEGSGATETTSPVTSPQKDTGQLDQDSPSDSTAVSPTIEAKDNPGEQVKKDKLKTFGSLFRFFSKPPAKQTKTDGEDGKSPTPSEAEEVADDVPTTPTTATAPTIEGDKNKTTGSASMSPTDKNNIDKENDKTGEVSANKDIKDDDKFKKYKNAAVNEQEPDAGSKTPAKEEQIESIKGEVIKSKDSSNIEPEKSSNSSKVDEKKHEDQMSKESVATKADEDISLKPPSESSDKQIDERSSKKPTNETSDNDETISSATNDLKDDKENTIDPDMNHPKTEKPQQDNQNTVNEIIEEDDRYPLPKTKEETPLSGDTVAMGSTEKPTKRPSLDLTNHGRDKTPAEDILAPSNTRTTLFEEYSPSIEDESPQPDFDESKIEADKHENSENQQQPGPETLPNHIDKTKPENKFYKHSDDNNERKENVQNTPEKVNTEEVLDKTKDPSKTVDQDLSKVKEKETESDQAEQNKKDQKRQHPEQTEKIINENDKTSTKEPVNNKASTKVPENDRTNTEAPENYKTSTKEPANEKSSAEESDNNKTGAEKQENDKTSVEEPENSKSSAEELENNKTSVEEPENNITSVEEPENNKTGVKEPENNKTSVEEPENNKTSGEEPENNKTSVKEPENNKTSVEEPENNKIRGEEPENNKTSAEETENDKISTKVKEKPRKSVTVKEPEMSVNAVQKDNKRGSAADLNKSSIGKTIPLKKTGEKGSEKNISSKEPRRPSVSRNDKTRLDPKNTTPASVKNTEKRRESLKNKSLEGTKTSEKIKKEVQANEKKPTGKAESKKTRKVEDSERPLGSTTPKTESSLDLAQTKDHTEEFNEGMEYVTEALDDTKNARENQNETEDDEASLVTVEEEPITPFKKPKKEIIDIVEVNNVLIIHTEVSDPTTDNRDALAARNERKESEKESKQPALPSSINDLKKPATSDQTNKMTAKRNEIDGTDLKAPEPSSKTKAETKTTRRQSMPSKSITHGKTKPTSNFLKPSEKRRTSWSPGRKSEKDEEKLSNKSHGDNKTTSNESAASIPEESIDQQKPNKIPKNVPRDKEMPVLTPTGSVTDQDSGKEDEWFDTKSTVSNVSDWSDAKSHISATDQYTNQPIAIDRPRHEFHKKQSPFVDPRSTYLDNIDEHTNLPSWNSKIPVRTRDHVIEKANHISPWNLSDSKLKLPSKSSKDRDNRSRSISPSRPKEGSRSSSSTRRRTPMKAVFHKPLDVGQIEFSNISYLKMDKQHAQAIRTIRPKRESSPNQIMSKPRPKENLQHGSKIYSSELQLPTIKIPEKKPNLSSEILDRKPKNTTVPHTSNRNTSSPIKRPSRSPLRETRRPKKLSPSYRRNEPSQYPGEFQNDLSVGNHPNQDNLGPKGFCHLNVCQSRCTCLSKSADDIVDFSNSSSILKLTFVPPNKKPAWKI